MALFFLTFYLIVTLLSYLRGDDRWGEELPVADGGEVEVQDDGVVHRQSHQHPDQVVLSAHAEKFRLYSLRIQKI